MIDQPLIWYKLPDAMQNTDSSRPNYIAPIPDAVSAKRKPVQGARNQDSNPDANDGKTRVKEGGTNVMSPKGGTQPTQPNPSSLRQ